MNQEPIADTTLSMPFPTEEIVSFADTNLSTITSYIHVLSSPENGGIRNVELIAQLGTVALGLLNAKNAALHLQAQAAIHTHEQPEAHAQSEEHATSEQNASAFTELAAVIAASRLFAEVMPVVHNDEEVAVRHLETPIEEPTSTLETTNVVAAELIEAEVVPTEDNVATEELATVLEDEVKEINTEITEDILPEAAAQEVQPPVENIQAKRRRTRKDVAATAVQAVTTIEAPEVVAQEVEAVIATDSETFKVPKLTTIALDQKELKELQAIVDFLSTKEERIALKDILQAVHGVSRMSKDKEKRLVEVLTAYAEAGILRAYGKTFGFRTAAEREISVEKIVETYYEADNDLTSRDIEALAMFEALSNNGTVEVNIGYFVREFYNVQQLDRPAFKLVIERLNELAARGYLRHAKGSPWYNVGKRRAYLLQTEQPTFVPVEQPQLVAPPEEILPETKTKEKNEFGAEAKSLQNLDLEFTERELEMLPIIMATITSDAWFKQTDFNFDSIVFSTSAARSQAFSHIAKKLLEAGVLVSNGKERGGRKYMLATQIAASSEQPKQTATVKANKAAKAPAAPTASKLAEPKPEKVKLTAPTNDPEVVDAFKQRLEETIQSFIAGEEKDSNKLSAVVRKLAEESSLTPEQTRGWITELVTNGQFHYVSKGGARYLVSGAAPEKTSQTQEQLYAEEEKETIKAWTSSDVTVAVAAFKEVLRFKHVQQGVKFTVVIDSILSQVEGLDEEMVRRSIRKIAKAGYLEVSKNANINTASPHSKKIYGTIIKFPTQSMKKRAKEDLKSLVEEMQALIETEAQ